MVSPLLFAVDLNADDADAGESRYGSHLAHHRHLFRDDDLPTTDVAQFGLMAWRVAMWPIMNPSYVRPHPRVQGTDEHWDDQGHAAVAVHLALPTPVPAHHLAWRSSSYRWSAGGLDPLDNRVVTALATLTIRVPVPLDLMPAPRYRLGVPDTTTAKCAVSILISVLNIEVGDLLADMEAGTADR